MKQTKTNQEENENLKVNINLINENLEKGKEEFDQTCDDATSTVGAYLFMFILFVISIAYLAPMYLYSVSAVLNLIFTCICGCYVWQCVKAAIKWMGKII